MQSTKPMTSFLVNGQSIISVDYTMMYSNIRKEINTFQASLNMRDENYKELLYFEVTLAWFTN